MTAARAALAASLGLLPAVGAAQVVGPSTGGAAALAQAERMLGHTKRVLMIAAHPDDEDTELLTYLVRAEGAEAAYLSLTRGEGGQNLVGPELGEALGLLRTGELLAARELDGARQYFTRAFDYGFSKTIDEAFAFWPRDTVLKDVVRIIRRFRPQLVISIFSGTPRDGHGQHQVAGWAAREAFRLAGDPRRFSELATEEGLEPWAPSKLYRALWFDSTAADVVLDGGRLDPEVGQSYRQIAMRSRSRHRSQDMGVLQEIGPSTIRLGLLEDRTGAGPRLFAGVDTAPPAPGAGGIAASDHARHAAVAAAIKTGVIVDAIADAEYLVAGDSVSLRLSIWAAGGQAVRGRVTLPLPDGWTASSSCLDREVDVEPGAARHCAAVVRVGADAAVTAPYFMEYPRHGALYRWSGDRARWGEPFGPPLLTARFEVAAGGSGPVSLEREVRYRFRDQALGEVRRPLTIVPRVDVRLDPAVAIWPIGRPSPLAVTVALQHSASDTTSGSVYLDLPPSWPGIEPRSFHLAGSGDRAVVRFEIQAPAGAPPGRSEIRAFARDDRGRRYDAGLFRVTYGHVEPRAYAVPSTLALSVARIAVPDQRRIGYVRGASDRVPEALASAGVMVEVLSADQLERGDLSGYDAIVVGSRAYETDEALVENNGRLLEFVRAGGHLVVQYQQHPFFRGGFAPYPLTVSPRHDRVTDEEAPVRLLVPDHPLLRSPNGIGSADFDGWIQERGLYFARSWDAAYRPLLEMHDPGEEPLQGGLLAATLGAGTYVYTGLAFFRQLPAAVPGAFRLFLNLLDPRSRVAVP